MFFAYVVRSISTGYLYKGHSQNLEERLRRHNSGMTELIKKYTPFELVKSAAGRRLGGDRIEVS